jgi:hypothetical protein
MADAKPHRWRADVTHRPAPGKEETNTYFFEEIEELSPMIEQGPHWDTIVGINIYLNRKNESETNPGFSQEDALKL